MQIITGPGGRKLAVAEWGDPAGRPVFYLHGSPSSRLERCLYPDALAGVRLITYDRPGYGGSDPHPGRDVAAAAADVAAIADAVGARRFAVYGTSGGGPHALACAALLPDRVNRAASLVGPAPYGVPGLDWAAGMTESNIAEFEAARRGRAAVEELLRPWVAEFQSNPAGLVDSLADELAAADTAVLRRPDVRAALIEDTAEAVRSGLAGWADDDLAFVDPWGFDPATIAVPVLIWHGHQDRLVSVAHAAALADLIPSVTLRTDPDAGHFGALDAHPDTLRWLLDTAG